MTEQETPDKSRVNIMKCGHVGKPVELREDDGSRNIGEMCHWAAEAIEAGKGLHEGIRLCLNAPSDVS